MLPGQLAFPAPHRLSRKRQSPSIPSPPPPPPPPREEADYGAAPPAKKKIRKRRQRRATPPKDTTAQTHDGEPITIFSLFLPSSLPASIVTNESSLTSYVLTATSTYLSLWTMESRMDLIDLRLRDEYADKLHFGSFLPRFLEVVMDHLAKVNVGSIEKLVLPSSLPSNIPQCIKSLSIRLPPSIRHLYIPLHPEKADVAFSSVELSAAFKCLAETDRIPNEVILVSQNPDHRKILEDLRRAHRDTKARTINFSFLSSPDKVAYGGGGGGPGCLGGPGGKAELAACEMVSPQTLLASLNVTSSVSTIAEDERTTGNEAGTGTSTSSIQPQHKQVLRRAFATDCSYTDDPHLSTDSTYASTVWDLERLHENGTDGTGTTIAVLDSGINYMSPAFKDKILAMKNFVAGSTVENFDCAIDSDGHGSLCAGIAAGSSFHCPITQGDCLSPCLRVPAGVAPGAKLIICKVVSTSSGDVDVNAFLEALKWLKELHMSGKKIDVVSISLASSYFSQERARVITELVNLGVIVVCCASNDGRMKMHPIAFPARLGHVICVGSHDANGKPTSFTPVGRELDFLAPGEDVWGPGPGTGGPFAMDCGSGTSCSTPAIAGLICLVLHDIRRRCEENSRSPVPPAPDTNIAGKPISSYISNVWVMRELLKHMSTSPGHHSEEIGYGPLNPYRLFDSSTQEIVRIVNEIVQDED